MTLPRVSPFWIAGALALVSPTTAARAQSTPRDSVAVPFPAPPVRRWQVGLLRADRIQHTSLSLTAGLAVGLLARRPAYAAWSGLALGLAKELYDVRSSGFDALDLCADALGAAGAAYGTRVVED